MAIQETDARLFRGQVVEAIKIPEPAQAGFEIALHFYAFADGEEDYFHIKYFDLENSRHKEIEAYLLEELDIDPEHIKRSEQKTCIKISGNVGLFSWSDLSAQDGQPYNAYYSVELLDSSDINKSI